MATNSGAKMAGASEKANSETELTMCDVLAEEEELEEDANAVLGDSDDTNCTYHMGYVPRQALYACATCKVSDIEPGGVCLACSYACHEGHELVELYTKRYFRCDCGNKRFPNNPCKLCPEKKDFNDENGYNQNFKGVYCTCSRPYPDEADNTMDEMIQCVFCEDWYHGRHIGEKVPDNEDFEEMVCSTCMSAHPFLYSYKVKFDNEKIISVTDNVKSESINKDVKTENGVGEANDKDMKIENGIGEASDKDMKIENGAGKANDVKPSVNNTHCENGIIKVEPNESVDKKKPVPCSFAVIKMQQIKPGPGFFPDGWRLELCTCDNCKLMYEQEKCLFVIDKNDTIKAYEERGKCRNGGQTQYDKGMSALSQLDRVKQMEAIRGYKNMKDKLKEYLKTFVEEGRTVEAKDIESFFDGMQKAKRQRLDMPFFCR